MTSERRAAPRHGDAAPRIVCVGDFPLGSRRAHAINVVKTSGGFARLGWDVLLLCREAEEGASADAAGLLRAYGEGSLRVEMLPSPDERTHPPGSDKRCSPMASWAVERARAFGAGVMYSRLAHAAVAWAGVGGTAIAETHAYIGEAKPGFQRLLDATRGERPVAAISTISERLRAHYVERGADPQRVCVVPDGVDVELFAPPGGADRPRPGATHDGTARGSHGRANPVAVYAGHLYDYKGIPTILGAAGLMPGVEFELIGGLAEDVERVRREVESRRLANVVLRGWIDHADLPASLWRADVLLLPPSAREASKDWTSPVKLGEYLAAGAPIVASSIPALRDWVDERVVTWFTPDDAGDMARAIGRALAQTPERARERQAAAMDLARRWSYGERARAMLRAGRVRTPLAVGA